jgi:hypothetical protein
VIEMNSQKPIPAPNNKIPERRLYSIKELCQLAHMSHATAWRRIGEFDSRRIGRRVFVTAESIERFLAGLPKERRAR